MNRLHSLIYPRKYQPSKFVPSEEGGTDLFREKDCVPESLLKEKTLQRVNAAWDVRRFFNCTNRKIASSSGSLGNATPTFQVSSMEEPEKDDSKISEEAVTKIQAIFRGKQARKSFLSRDLYPRYKSLIESEQGVVSCPKAEFGKTPVYLPEQIPEVVLKGAGKKKAVERFDQMECVRRVLTSQKCTHLVIPKARLFGGFLVEERMLVSSNAPINILIYRNNQGLFDGAVRDMVRLYSKIYISYLVKEKIDRRGVVSVYKIRYDNFSFFIDKSGRVPLGKIALIDLERSKGERLRSSDQKLVRLSQIFPLHLHILKEEALLLGMEFDETAINHAARRGTEYMCKMIREYYR